MTYQYQINRLLFSDGEWQGISSLTILIGPNNAGKSRALRDIVAGATTASKGGTVVREVDAEQPDHSSALEAWLPERRVTVPGSQRYPYIDPHLTKLSWLEPNVQWFHMIPTDPQYRPGHIASVVAQMASLRLALLTAENRLLIAKESSAIDVTTHGEASNVMQLFYRDREAEESLRSTIKAAFAKDIRFDMFSRPSRYLFRVADDFSDTPEDWRQLGDYFSRFETLDEQGDGIRSYVGTVATMSALPKRLIIIDEPEAFLHPPQSFQLGEFVADRASAGRQIIVATHSADFLRGAASRCPDLTVIRIERSGQANRVRAMGAADVLALARDPMRSASRVLEGLFYSAVVVVEADSDARFYQLLLRRLQGPSDWHFVNADNKQTVPMLVEPYRRLGVRACGIVDFDVLRDRTEFARQLASFGIVDDDAETATAARDRIAAEIDATPTTERLTRVRASIQELGEKLANSLPTGAKNEAADQTAAEKLLSQLRNDLDRIRDASQAWSRFKQFGSRELSKARQSDFDTLYNICRASGLFINPYGELESWLSDLGAPYTAQKQDWIRRALTLVPNLTPDPKRQPWKFATDVRDYLV